MLMTVLQLFRVSHWLKNLMLYFPPFLGGTLFCNNLAPRLPLPFIAFCAASSATYILNDLLDKEHDSHHPDKLTRPIVSGSVTASHARLFVLILLISSVIIALNISSKFFIIVITYCAVSFAYSLKLKEIVLVDIFCITFGFLLRLQAGGEAFNVVISEWLYLSVFLLSLFLCTGKRLSEKQRLGDLAHQHRKALAAYPKGFLEGTMYMTAGSVLVTYTMYVITRHSPLLLYSVPLCCFGLLHYIMRIMSGKGGDPTESLTRDFPLLIVAVAWVALVGWGIYIP